MNDTVSTRGAILFDLDGTLVDTLPDLLGAMNATLGAMGRRMVTSAELRHWIGDGVAALVRRAVDATGGLADGSYAAVTERYYAYYETHVAVGSRVYPGVDATLRGLRDAGYRLGVCTNKHTNLSVALLETLGLRSLFEAVIGGDALKHRKPSAEHIAATLGAMGMTGSKALMVGDSENDVAAARNAKIPVIAVTFGYAHRTPADLGADAVIDDFSALPALVERML